MKASLLSEQQSGYVLGIEQWSEYLSCWRREMRALDVEDRSEFLNFKSSVLTNVQSSFNDSDSKFTLPQSLLDFHNAYVKMGGLYRDEDKNFGEGVFAVEKIEPLKSFLPTLHEARAEYLVESEDSRYFKYGLEQEDDNAFKLSYNKNALVIAQYGYDASEVMLLYPDSKTSDGEYEVAILGQAWEFRAPSFSEMMRQLSFYFLADTDTTPPYSQKELINSCADCIKLSEVWWT